MSTLGSALRSLARTPRLSLAAIACLGLGSAALACVATLLSALVLRPVPFPDSERLVRLWMADSEGNPRESFSIPELAELGALKNLDGYLGTARTRLVALFDRGAERVRGEAVTPGYFEMLGLRAAAGRLLESADHAPDAARVIVLSHATWMARYGGDPGAVGRTLRSEGTSWTVVGVAPPGFAGTIEDDVVEFWVPLGQYEPAAGRSDRTSRGSWAIGRLRPGVGEAALAGELEAWGHSLRERFPAEYAHLRPAVEPMGENWRGGLRRGGYAIAGAGLLLLLVAAANVGGLLLARVLERRRDLALCAVLGASRGRIVRGLMLEAGLLALAGGLLGVGAAPTVLRGFLAVSPVQLPTYVTLAPDATALGLSVVFLGLTALVAGTAPALVGGRVAPADALRSGSRGSVGGAPERRFARRLVTIEVALTLVLLVTGGLLLQSLRQFERAALGYRTDGIARLAVTISRLDVPRDDALAAFRTSLRARLAAVPGVQSVGLVWPTLPPWDPFRTRLVYPGLAGVAAEEGVPVGAHLVDERLLPTLGIALAAGRGFEEADAGRPVALVSRALAVRMGGLERALGSEVRLLGDPDLRQPFRIVGITENVAWDGLGEQDTRRYIHYGAPGDVKGSRADLFLPLSSLATRSVSIAASTRGDAAALIETLRREIGRLAPASAVHWTSTMDEQVAEEYAPARFYAVLVSAFSASALLLTGVGLFALLSHDVARRTGEIGLRMALGARRRDVARLVIASSFGPLVLGSALGLLGALATGRGLTGLLYETPALDAAAFAGATLLLFGTALAASLLPARRAVGVEPMQALRSE